MTMARAVPETAYPRPDFVRSSLNWQSLNGSWDFIFDDQDIGLIEEWSRSGLPDSSHRRKIEVPYTFQTPASGINDQGAHEVIWYERSIDDIRTEQEIAQGFQLLVRFGAVDYEATVWVNGCYAGAHRGGHVPFDLDISNTLRTGPAKLVVRVRDSPYDLTQPRGKQYWKPKPENIFYTPSSGIWQNVWLEAVPSTRIADSSNGTIFRCHDIQGGNLGAKIAIHNLRSSKSVKVKISARLAGLHVATQVADIAKDSQHVNISLNLRLNQEQQNRLPTSLPPITAPSAWREGLALWSPKHPTLYDLQISLCNENDLKLDEVNTTIGMRSVEWMLGDRTFRLNGEPIFQTLVLDQGYWPKTGLTPPSSESLKTDIELAQKMGFNGCRKHQKVEDPIFLYWADRLGYLVWGEMANAYEFNDTYVARFDQEWMESVRRDINHPCIVVWTPGNESWGYKGLKQDVQQRNHIRSLYYMTRTLDPSRPINDNCGWEHVCNDLTTFHEYADAPALRKICHSLEGILSQRGESDMFVLPIPDDPGAQERPGAPILCTEFGGVNIAPSKDQVAGDQDWGYTTASDPDDLLKRVQALVMAVVEGGLCCGFVYTQLTDVEQEVNGLYSFDRKPKLAVEKVREIMDKASSTYFEILSQKK